jgi:hypothetical protein
LQVTLAGQTEQRSKALQVFAEPQLQLSSSCQNLSCTLTASASSPTGPVGTVQWTVNNQTLSGLSVNVTFAAAGTYQAVAEVSDSAGQKVQKTLSVTVTAPVVVTPAEPAAKSSSGGSLGITSLLLLCFIRRRN